MEPVPLQNRIDQIPWYHDFDFPNGFKARTKNVDAEAHRQLWDWMRSELDKIDFAGKTILDIGCWDGYWSFYAEQRGASRVLATDDQTQNWSGNSGLDLARELMGSSIETRTDVSIYEAAKLNERFDIILCMGVYYHLVDPFLGFSQVRHCAHEQSIVVFEGDFAPDWFVKPQQSAYLDLRDGWHCFMPTLTCLRQMLEGNYFHVLTESTYEGQATRPANRVLIVCKPFVSENTLHCYRPPLGLDVYDPRFFQSDSTAPLLHQSTRVASVAGNGSAQRRMDSKSPIAFVSYARNQEDVMLHRAFRDVNQGFYIDVGAQDPVIDSVTKAFYDLGWRGINIEPDERNRQKLQSERPHDINLVTRVGREGGVVFHAVQGTCLSTTNTGYTQRQSEVGCQTGHRDAPFASLDEICEDRSVATIHFLKVQIEHTEHAVLQGFSFERLRPWIIILAATESNSDHKSFTEWEDLLLSRRYFFIYFDGLNRFFAAEEHADLARHFSSPPNCLDQYVSYEHWRTRAELDEVQAAKRDSLIHSLNHMLAEVQSVRAEAQAREWTLQRSLAEREREVGGLREEVGGLRAEMSRRGQSIAERDRQLFSLQTKLAEAQLRLKSIRSSITWKLTSPLRETKRAAIRVVELFR